MSNNVKTLLQEVAAAPDAETQAVVSRSIAIQDHLDHADARFAPSLFWRDASSQNVDMLLHYGVNRFKKSIAQNYFNWAIQDPADPQMASLLRWWAQSPTRLPFEAALGADAGLVSINGTAFLADAVSQKTYAFFVGLIWALAVAGDHYRISPFLSEPLIGEPVEITLDDKMISQDLANSLREFNRFSYFLMERDRPVFAEIGAGYGRVGDLILKVSKARYWIFDIAPALAIAEWYLSKNESLKIFRWRSFDDWSEIEEEATNADVCLFSVDQILKVPDGAVSVFAAISALHEMNRHHIELMMREMARITREVIYLKNWTEWYNAVDDWTFVSNMLMPPKGWTVAFDRPDDVIPGFTEKMFVLS